MSKKKACLNPDCNDYKKTKYKTKEQMCPHCGEKLEIVCAQKDCYKVIFEKSKEKYCPLCKAEIDDRNAKILDGTKKVVVGMASIAIAIVGPKIGLKKK